MRGLPGALAVLICLIIFNVRFLSAQSIKVLHQGKPCSIRGLSVVNNKTAWLSGSNGYIAHTNDGGLTWKWQQIKGFETSDFRDIEAFSAKEAVIMSSGTPALILRTEDGGLNWAVCYRNDNKAYFFDAMDFKKMLFNRIGAVLGDPINGRFLILHTQNGGKTWKEEPISAKALPGEAAFAASGTCLRLGSRRGELEFVTGGSVSRFIRLYGGMHHIWDYKNLPITHGQDSKGAFSIAADKRNRVITGGNYLKNLSADSVTAHRGTADTISFVPSYAMPSGYQSCVVKLKRNTFLSTGTSGSNLSIDGGKIWKQIDKGSYNVCQKAKHGNLVILAGDKGNIAVLKN